MEPISTATILTGLAINFASDIIINGIKSIQETGVDHDLGSAYNNALKKWSSSSQLRHQKEHLSGQKLRELQQYLKGENVNCDDNTLQFIQIFEKEISDAKYQSLNNYINFQMHKWQNDLLNTINDKKQILHKEPIPELRTFAKPKNYIDRTISGYSNSSSLIEIIKNEHAVALLGEGGLGKTTELDHTASILSNEGWYCGLVQLINYADSLEKLIESQFEHWQNIPTSSNVLILLDGLDEVNSSNISKAENEIVGLTRTHKNVHFLISYRNSYTLFLSLNNKKEESKEITRVNLDPISEELIKKYINDFALEPSVVIEQFQQHKLLEICKNPFYLVNYIEIINKTGKVPDNKSDFFENILSLRFQSEQQKGSEVTREVRRREGKLRKKLEALALTMQLAGKYQIENNDIQEIIDDPDLLDTTRRIVLYESGITDAAHWRFEHNNFQEYLAAKKLSKCSWEQMQSIPFLPNKKLKPKWYNTISFLINQLDPASDLYKKLIEWLSENDRVAFIKLEIVHLDLAIRNQVFYFIYKEYKEKEIVFYTEFSAKELASFCDLENNQELIDFLLAELMPDMNIQNLYNVVELFEAIKPNDQKDIERIAIALSGYLKKEEYNKYNINSSILETYIKWEWKNEVVFNEIINNDTLINEGITRSTLLHYLKEVQSPLLTADLILRCLKIRQNDTVHTSDMYSIKEAISALSELEIITLLDKLTLRNENDQSRKQKRDFINVVKAIEERASVLYPTYNEILSAVNQFVMATLEFVYRAEPAWAMKPFYEKHSLVFPLFKDAFPSEKQQTDANPIYYRFKFSGFLADYECLDWVLNEYQKGNIPDEDIIKFRNSMNRYSNGVGYQSLTKKMNEITDGLFFPDRPDIYTETYTKTEELYAQAILDRNLFISHIEKAFAFYSKEEISWKEYWDREDEEEHISDIEYHINRRCLRDFMDNDKTTTLNEVLTSLGTDKDWESLQLKEHYELSKDEKLQEKNKQWIRNWCEKHESEIDFKNALQDNEEGGITYAYWAIYYIQFCIDTGYYSRSKQVLLDLISCFSGFVVDKENALYEYLQLHLTNEEINARIVQNLKNGVSAEIVLREYLTIIQNENLLNAKEYLPQYVLDKKYKKWNRYQTLSVYFELGGKTSNVKGLLSELNFDEDSVYDWYIIDEFIKQNKTISANKLLTFINDEQIDKYKLAIRLIKCGRIEGLDLLHFILKEKNSNNNYDEFRMGEFEGFVKFGDFKGMDIIPRLTDMILIHLQPAFKNDKWSNLIGQLFNLLAFYLSSDSQSLGSESISRIEKALLESENTSIYQIVYRNYQKLRLDLDVQTDSECEIDVAIKKLTEIGITN